MLRMFPAAHAGISSGLAEAPQSNNNRVAHCDVADWMLIRNHCRGTCAAGTGPFDEVGDARPTAAQRGED